MEPVLYVMAILGCADDASQCRNARVEPVTYQSAAACQAAMPAALMRNSDLSFPTISAACQQRGERMVRNEQQNARRGG